MTDPARLRRDLPSEIPDHVDDPGAKAKGVVTLPRRVNWSEPDPTYDLDDRHQRALVYEQVMAEGTADDVRRFVDVDALIELWEELVLPRSVSQAWIAWILTHRGIRLQDWRDRARPARHPGR